MTRTGTLKKNYISLLRLITGKRLWRKKHDMDANGKYRGVEVSWNVDSGHKHRTKAGDGGAMGIFIIDI